MCLLCFKNNLLTIKGVHFALISKKTPLSKLLFAFVSISSPHADPEPEEEMAAHYGTEAECKLVELMQTGMEYLTPSEVRRIIRAVRAGAIDRIGEEMQLYASDFPVADANADDQLCLKAALR
jgi:hypothetical protein